MPGMYLFHKRGLQSNHHSVPIHYPWSPFYNCSKLFHKSLISIRPPFWNHSIKLHLQVLCSVKLKELETIGLKGMPLLSTASFPTSTSSFCYRHTLLVPFLSSLAFKKPKIVAFIVTIKSACQNFNAQLRSTPDTKLSSVHINTQTSCQHWTKVKLILPICSWN